MAMNPGSTGKDGAAVLCKSATCSVDTSIGAVAFGPFKKGAKIAGVWLSGNTTLGYTPTAVMARMARSLDGVALGSVTAVVDGPDVLGGNASLDGTVLGNSLSGVPVLLTGRSFYPINVEVDEFPYIVVYFGGSGFTCVVTVGLSIDETKRM